MKKKQGEKQPEGKLWNVLYVLHGRAEVEAKSLQEANKKAEDMELIELARRTKDVGDFEIVTPES